MRIAQVVAVYPPYRGGMARIAEEYTHRLRRRQHEVDVFTALRASTPGDPPFVRKLAAVRFGNAAVAPGLTWLLSGYDLVHLHYPFFGGAEFALLRRLLKPGQPLVVTYQMDAEAVGLKGGIFDMYRRIVLPVAVRVADRILVSSEDYARSSALARFPEARRRMEIHPLGVDLDRFHPGEDQDLRTKLGVSAHETVLIFVGTLDAAHNFKGLPILFEALAGLRHLRWRLVVVGDGSQRVSLEGLARDRQINSLVSFAGGVSDDSLPRYYRAANVHVFPSTGRSEAYGLVVTEAAASGIPSIVSCLPGVRTLVRQGETGWHVSPGDPLTLREAVEEAVRRPEYRGQFGGAARQRAEAHWAWDPLIDRLEETYENLLNAAGTSTQTRT